MMILGFFSLFLIACMEDITEPVDVKYHSSADLISYLETHGDFINSNNNPAIISVDEAYNNLSNYLLMDIRIPSQYQSGHIEGARNFDIEQLLDSLEFNQVSIDAGIIIISESGQKAAYATALLRMYGFTNIFSLDFGMAQWNERFSDVWINARGDSEWWFLYTTKNFAKPKKNNILPDITITDNTLTTEEFLKKRIKKFLSEEEYINSIANIEEIDELYLRLYSKFKDAIVFCYGDKELYDHFRYFPDVAPPVTWGGHPLSSTFYDAQIDFKASTNLLTLPINETIFNYTFNGQKSLFITAYLRFIGYNAKSVYYGAVSMMYNKLKLEQFPECFQESNIKNYPIVD
jgi:rhodanese-related sulfurtransferase